MPKLSRLFLAASLSLMALTAHAELEVIGYWKLGKAGATDGESVGASVAGEPGATLTVSGNPTHSADAPEGFPGSFKFQKGDILFHETPVTRDIAQFGLEAWVKSDNPKAGDAISVVENGRGSPGSGYGNIQTPADAWDAIYGGTALIESKDVIVEVGSEWTHIALVRDEEDFGTRLFINGEMVYSSEKRIPVPNVPAENGAFTIAGGVAASGQKIGNFSGHIAAVRIFKFKPGEFKPEELLNSQPPK